MLNTQQLQNTTDTLDHYRAEFERSIQDAAGSPLADVRKSAMTWFLNKGFPARRDEEWRFTDIRPITDTSFTLAGFEQQNVTHAQIGAALFPELKANRLVFVNGRYAAHLSQLQELPCGCRHWQSGGRGAYTAGMGQEVSGAGAECEQSRPLPP